MTTLDDAELFLTNIDRGINDLKLKFESKQSERLLSNYVWVVDYIESNVKRNIKPLKSILTKMREKHVGDFRSTTNFDVASRHCDEINNALDEIIKLYKMRLGSTDIKIRWQYSIPKITDSLVHLKNRFNIIKGQLSRKVFEYEEDSWF